MAHIDAGCGPGKFLLRFAWEGVLRDKGISNLNFLGVEIRKGLVDMATRYRDQLKFNNVAYLHAEFNADFIFVGFRKIQKGFDSEK